MLKKKKRSYIIFILLLSILLLAACTCYFANYEKVYISEIGRGTQKEEDYILIKNDGAISINLSELMLSEDDGDTYGYRLSSYGRLNPGENTKILLEDAGVSITKNGGNVLCLSTVWGKTIDSIKIPAVSKNSVAKREGSTGDKWVHSEMSDGAEEATAYVKPPILSHKSGFYTEDIVFTIQSPEENEVYYSLDGSVPTKETGILYTEPFILSDASLNDNNYSARTDMSARSYYIPENKIDKANLITAVCIDKEGRASKPVSSVCFVNSENNDLYEKYCGITVLSINADSEDLFGYDKGILVLGKLFDENYAGISSEELNAEENKSKYIDFKITANFSQDGPEWERISNINVFKDCNPVLNQEVMVKRRGVASSVGASKGFALKAKSDLGNDTVQYDLFGGGYYPNRVNLKLGNVILYDAFVSDLTKDRSTLSYEWCPVALFIQGEYWGTYAAFEKYDDYYFEQKYGLKNVTVLSNYKVDGEETMEEYDYLHSWAKKNDLSQKANYEYFCQKVDVQSFIDTYCIMIYMGCTDNEDRYNIAMWKPEYDAANELADGKWHWSIYDVDSALKDPAIDNVNKEIREGRRAFFEHDIMKSLIQNEDFQRQFAISFCDIMNFNFGKERVDEKLSEYKTDYSDYLYRMYERFYGTDFANAFLSDGWPMFYGFWENRADYVTGYVAEGFGIDDVVKMYIAADCEDVHIDVNTSKNVLLSEEYTEVYYYPKYEVTLSPSDDTEKFDHWEITDADGVRMEKEENLSVLPTEGLCIKLCTK